MKQAGATYNCIQQKEQGRMANFELLRLVSMLMVVALHYLSKGEVLPKFAGSLPTANGYIAYFLESICIVAVNAFILVSGYFLIESEFKWKKAVRLVCQTLFYALLIALLLTVTGVLPVTYWNLYTLCNEVFPIQTEHYWFMTYYIFLYCLTPLLNKGIKAMSERQLQGMIGVLLLLFSLPKSIIPVPLAVDNKGYDLIWFVCVYTIAAYFRLYGIPFLTSRKKSMLCYMGITGAVFLVSLGLGFFSFYTGKLSDQVGEVFHYNHILNIMAAAGIFAVFSYSRIGDKAGRIICKISPYTLGVYLLHEQLEVRYLWPKWFHVEEVSKTILFLPHFLGSILLIFTLGIVVDYIRSLLFGKITEIVSRKTNG